MLQVWNEKDRTSQMIQRVLMPQISNQTTSSLSAQTPIHLVAFLVRISLVLEVYRRPR